MRVNVTELRLQAEREFIKFFPVNDEMVKDAEESGKEYRAHPRYLVLTRPEAAWAIKCLRGEADFYPYFDDGIHHIKFAQDGIRESARDGDRWQEYYFIVPGEWLAPIVEGLLLATDGEAKGAEVVIPTEELERIREKYAPKYEWDYGNGVYQKIQQDLEDVRQTRLQSCLDHLPLIAQNSSDGIPSVIHIHFDGMPKDGMPASYYWSVEATNRKTGKVYRVLHGGIIAHPKHEKAPDGFEGDYYDLPVVGWEYSTHT